MTKFEGRFYIIDDCLTDLKCWIYEFEAKRSTEEWAESHLQENYSVKDLRKLFELPAEGDLQVLFTADIDGKTSYGPDGDDYNEWLDIEKVAYQRVPEEFARYFTPQVQEPTNGQAYGKEEPQRPESTIQGDRQASDINIEHVRFSLIAEITIQQAIKNFNCKVGREYRGLLAKDLSQAVSQGLTPEKCKECCGNGLDHPCSSKSRNTDDDTCPRCKGTGIEPAPSPEQEQATSNFRRY